MDLVLLFRNLAIIISIMINRMIELAKKCDIDDIGFTTTEVTDTFSDFLSMHEMSVLDELMHHAYHPTLQVTDVYDKARSVIVIVESYTNEKSRCGELCGDISLSSYGTDYHHILMDKMKRFSMMLEEELTVASKPLVDINPLNERYFAIRAGLGRIGKNQCFYSNRYGSFVFIGLILIDYSLDVSVNDQIYMEACKNCNKCVESCPGKALYDGAFTVENCIAFNNISKKNLNYNRLKQFKNMVYGCDTCQLVCPVNQRHHHYKSYFDGPMDITSPDLIELLHLSKSEFKKRYGNAALFWRGKNIIQRNAIIALLNSQGTAWFEEKIQSGDIHLTETKMAFYQSIKKYY